MFRICGNLRILHNFEILFSLILNTQANDEITFY